jgi:hypothetical protein
MVLMNKRTTLPPQADGTPYTTLDSLVRAVVNTPKAVADQREAEWKRAKEKKKKSSK